MTDTLRLLLACSAFWVAVLLLYGKLAYRAGWNSGRIDGMDYARKHIGTLTSYKGE